MDIQEILKSETVRSMIKKTGITDAQLDPIMNQVAAAIQNKFKENPKQLSSLLSSNPNTEDDEKLASAVQDDFMSGLIKKVGLPDNIAQSVSGFMPQIMSHYSNKLTAKGANSEDGLAGILSGFTDMFDGDNSSSSKSAKGGGGSMGMIKKLFGSFFGK